MKAFRELAGMPGFTRTMIAALVAAAVLVAAGALVIPDTWGLSRVLPQYYQAVRILITGHP